MSHWNHRVVRRVFDYGPMGGEVLYEIHEAYYDEDGKCRSITVDGVDPVGDTLEELQNDLTRMMRALEKPVLDYETREELP